MTKSGFGFLAAIAFAAAALDQWIKQLVEQGMAYHETIELLPFLALFRTHNTGIAFSMFNEMGQAPMIVMVLVVIVIVGWLASHTSNDQIFARIGFALILGGAFGNLIDRITLGYVIDYVLFHTPIWSFAVFNLADAFITVGAIMVVLDELLSWRRERTR
jgi:signal peptidase II